MAVPAYLQNRLDLLMIDQDTRHNLGKLIPVFRDDIDAIIHRFYNHITSFPETKEIFKSDDQINMLKSRQKNHWISLFSCSFNDKYVESAVRIGRIHYLHGVAPYLYIAGYNFFHCELIEATSSRHANSYELSNLLASVTRVISLDMDLALTAYTREYWRDDASNDSLQWLIN